MQKEKYIDNQTANEQIEWRTDTEEIYHNNFSLIYEDENASSVNKFIIKLCMVRYDESDGQTGQQRSFATKKESSWSSTKYY